MGQSSYVYILWLVILAAGLWLIIGFGSVLHAQEDLAGDWELTPEQSAAAEPLRMKVEQSGKYFSIDLPQRSTPIRMKLVEQVVTDQHFGEHKRIVLRGEGQTATFEGRSGGDLWRFSIAWREEFVARRVERTYPRPTSATQPAAASVHAR